jgi:hypothetical protein
MAWGTEITSQPSHWFGGETAMNVERFEMSHKVTNKGMKATRKQDEIENLRLLEARRLIQLSARNYAYRSLEISQAPFLQVNRFLFELAFLPAIRRVRLP